MKINTIGKSILTAVFLFMSMHSSASLIFNFNENLSNSHTVDYTSDGFTLSVAAFKNLMADNGELNRRNDGLGVSNRPGSGNIGAQESISFSLDKPFMGTVSIYFNLFNENDSAIVAIDGASDVTIAVTKQRDWTFALPGAASFSITGLEVAGTSQDKFRIIGLEFTSLKIINVVPEPSALVILSLGIIFFSLRRFKKIS